MNSKESSRAEIEKLIARAKFHADEALDVGHPVTPTLYLHCQNGTTTGYDLGKMIGNEGALATNLRLMCVAEGADAMVLCGEAWMMREKQRDQNNWYAPATEPSEREEVVILLAESREESFQRVLPIIRMDDEQFFRFAEEFEIHNPRLVNQWGKCLPKEIPDEHERKRAESILESQGIFPINGKRRERGRSLAWF